MKHAQTLPPTDPNGKSAVRDSKSKPSRPIMETNTLGDLTFEKFLFSDMGKFSAEIKKTETRMFSPKVPNLKLQYPHLYRNILLK